MIPIFEGLSRVTFALRRESLFLFFSGGLLAFVPELICQAAVATAIKENITPILCNTIAAISTPRRHCWDLSVPYNDTIPPAVVRRELITSHKLKKDIKTSKGSSLFPGLVSFVMTQGIVQRRERFVCKI